MTSPENVFHANFYLLHNEKRLEHLNSLNLPILKKMTVLEVGAGIGDHTKYFIDAGCKVVSTDGRTENIQTLKKNLGEKAEVALLNLESPEPNEIYDRLFDIVYCYGTLYHLSDPNFVLKYLEKRCRTMFLLETCVSFGTEEIVNFHNENAKVFSESVTGTGCRPTRTWLFEKLKSLYDYVYIPKTQPDHKEFPIDWTIKPSSKLIRSVMIGSKIKMKNDQLLKYLPDKQEKYKIEGER